MQAIRVAAFGGPEVLQTQTVADPVPGAGQVLVRVRAAGVNPFEAAVRAGTYARLPALPFTPGVDAAGTVAAVGEGVRSWKAGDRVYVAGSVGGTYAEYALAEAACVHALPARASFAEGAALGVPCATAYRALFQRGRAQPGEWVLVHGGTGGVGIAAIQLARAAGLRVIATGSTDAGRALAAAQGAERVCGHAVDPALLAEWTGGHGVDLVLELAADRNLAADLTLLAPRGRVVVIGNHGSIAINPRDAMSRDADILGMLLWNTPPEDDARIHAALGAALAAGTLAPVIAREYGLADAPAAHAALGRPGAVGKIILAC